MPIRHTKPLFASSTIAKPGTASSTSRVRSGTSASGTNASSTYVSRPTVRIAAKNASGCVSGASSSAAGPCANG